MAPILAASIDGAHVGRAAPNQAGPWQIRAARPAGHRSEEGFALSLRLEDVGLTNALAWLGRRTGLPALQRFRTQRKNRQLRIHSIALPDGEVIFDFSQRDAPYSAAFVRRRVRLGMNIVGFLTADLGVGESARCMARAAEAADIPRALVPLKLHCKNRLGDTTFADRLQDSNPHEVNVVHIDPPAARDIDHHHGPDFRKGKYNIAYFAWELPEFPDAWTSSFRYFDEIWCPSDFTTAAIRQKSPLPVLTFPHAIGFAPPHGPVASLRARFQLPRDRFLFLTLFDLNSYAARKNPQAVVAAFRRSGLAGRGAALVVKVQNAAGNPQDFAALQESLRDLPDTVLIAETLSRSDVYALEAACDCFVSLHRSEGFGLAVAECMRLGKPVITTDWSATAEFARADNSFPVRAKLVTLEQNHGPYARGSIWADPDIDHAAEGMRTLFHDPALAARIGQAAQATITARFAPAVVGEQYRRRLESIALF